ARAATLTNVEATLSAEAGRNLACCRCSPRVGAAKTSLASRSESGRRLRPPRRFREVVFAELALTVMFRPVFTDRTSPRCFLKPGLPARQCVEALQKLVVRLSVPGFFGNETRLGESDDVLKSLLRLLVRDALRATR